MSIKTGRASQIQGGMSYIRLTTSGIPISHHIRRILVKFTIPHRGKASHMTLYGLSTDLMNH